ncbi:Conserved_hypothetical protein [Hexamita inflata]|uniref:Zer-1-like leucine-rich repeats region domain-containing protein n=1 Tax=Hexamita inflata TaxID=28002 RepID=A0AA86VAF8_9EUKA|nr:Conserved hypothetical protein [Hexamita inflata]
MQHNPIKQFTKFDQEMTEKFEKRIKNGYLIINNHQMLENLIFISNFSLQILTIGKSQIQKTALASSVTELNIVFCDIINLNAHEFKDVRVLNLTGNKLNTIENFRTLQRLELLNISQNEFIDISFLQSSPLIVLNACDNKIKDTSVLMNLSNLKELILSRNEDIDLNPLKYLCQLTKLHIANCGMYNIEILKPLTNLEELDISGCQNVGTYRFEKQSKLIVLKMQELKDYTIIKQFSFLKQLKQLKELDIFDNLHAQELDISYLPVQLTKLTIGTKYYSCIINITDICLLSNLQYLDFHNILTIDIKPISKMTHIRHLNLSDCGLKSLSDLQELINLEELDISSNTYIDIQVIQLFNSLIKLNLSNTHNKKIDVIKYLVNLKELNLNKNYGIDITPLQYLTKLISLDLEGCYLNGISALIPLCNLEQLNLKNNLIIDIYPLNQMTNLQVLSIADNQVQNLAAIWHLTYFDDFLITDQRQTTNKWYLFFANLARMMYSTTTILRKIQSKRTNCKIIDTTFKDRVYKILLKHNSDRESFMNTVALLFQALNRNDTYQ